MGQQVNPKCHNSETTTHLDAWRSNWTGALCSPTIGGLGALNSSDLLAGAARPHAHRWLAWRPVHPRIKARELAPTNWETSKLGIGSYIAAGRYGRDWWSRITQAWLLNWRVLEDSIADPWLEVTATSTAPGWYMQPGLVCCNSALFAFGRTARQTLIISMIEFGCRLSDARLDGRKSIGRASKLPAQPRQLVFLSRTLIPGFVTVPDTASQTTVRRFSLFIDSPI